MTGQEHFSNHRPRNEAEDQETTTRVSRKRQAVDETTRGDSSVAVEDNDSASGLSNGCIIDENNHQESEEPELIIQQPLKKIHLSRDTSNAPSCPSPNAAYASAASADLSREQFSRSSLDLCIRLNSTTSINVKEWSHYDHGHENAANQKHAETIQQLQEEREDQKEEEDQASVNLHAAATQGLGTIHHLQRIDDGSFLEQSHHNDTNNENAEFRMIGNTASFDTDSFWQERQHPHQSYDNNLTGWNNQSTPGTQTDIAQPPAIPPDHPRVISQQHNKKGRTNSFDERSGQPLPVTGPVEQIYQFPHPCPLPPPQRNYDHEHHYQQHHDHHFSRSAHSHVPSHNHHQNSDYHHHHSYSWEQQHDFNLCHHDEPRGQHSNGETHFRHQHHAYQLNPFDKNRIQETVVGRRESRPPRSNNAVQFGLGDVALEPSQVSYDHRYHHDIYRYHPHEDTYDTSQYASVSMSTMAPDPSTPAPHQQQPMPSLHHDPQPNPNLMPPLMHNNESALHRPPHRSRGPNAGQLLPYHNRRILPLATSEDENWLSEFLCFVRSECIEVFKASPEDVAVRMNSKKVLIDQVGFRCRFCAHLPARERTGRSSSFPSSIDRIYQSLTMMIRDHFPNCNAMPRELKDHYLRLKANSSQGATDSKRYWIDSAYTLGLKDTEESGIRFV